MGLLQEALGTVGTVLGTPGAVVTTALGSGDIGRALRGIIHPDERIYGEEMLRSLLGDSAMPEDSWGSTLAGMGADMAGGSLAGLGVGTAARLAGSAVRKASPLVKALMTANEGPVPRSLRPPQARAGVLRLGEEEAVSNFPKDPRIKYDTGIEGLYSRFVKAVEDAPEEFVGSPEQKLPDVPARTIQTPKGPVHKEGRPGKTIAGQTPYEQLQGYLKDRAHPEEIKWFLGDKFVDQPKISKNSLIQAINERGSMLSETKFGGAPSPSASKLVLGDPEHGPVRWGPEWQIPGGKNTTETLLNLPVKTPNMTLAEENELMDLLAHAEPNPPANSPLRLRVEELMKKREVEGAQPQAHFSHDEWAPHQRNLVGWIVTDDRPLPHGGKLRGVTEQQSDWNQAGAKYGYKDDTNTYADQMPAMDMRVPNNPFKGQVWQDLLTKKAIIDAVKDEATHVAYAPSRAVQAVTGGKTGGQELYYDQIYPKKLQEIGTKYGGEKGTVPFNTRRELMWAKTEPRSDERLVAFTKEYPGIPKVDIERTPSGYEIYIGEGAEISSGHAETLDAAKQMAENLTQSMIPQVPAFKVPALKITNKLIAAVKRGLPLMALLPPVLHQAGDEDSPLVRALLAGRSL